jgi:hypothetical protein
VGADAKATMALSISGDVRLDLLRDPAKLSAKLKFFLFQLLIERSPQMHTPVPKVRFFIYFSHRRARDR